MPHSINKTESALQALEKDLGELQGVLHQNATDYQRNSSIVQEAEILQEFTDINVEHLYII